MATDPGGPSGPSLADGESSIRDSWRLVLGCFLISTGFNAYALAPASLLPVLIAEFEIGKSIAGLAVSAVFLGWAGLQLPGGWLIDRRDNRRLVTLGVAILAIASIGGMLATGFWSFLLSRFVGGASAVFVWTACIGIVARTLPAGHRGLGTSIFVASGPAGVTLAQFAGPFLANLYGWRSVFGAYLLLTLAGLPFLWSGVETSVKETADISVREFLVVLRDGRILLVSTVAFCTYSLFLFFVSWMPTYATEELLIDLAAAGAITAVVPAIGLVARPFGGWLSDVFPERRPILVAAFVLSVPLLYLVPQLRTARLFGVGLLVGGITSQLGIGVVFTYAGELAPANATGTTLALVNTFAFSGALIAPVVIGWTIDAYSWVFAFGVAMVFAVLGTMAAVAIGPPSEQLTDSSGSRQP